ncbi:MAG: sulfite exporter TauE/SafE family protein [Planctomycetota bacterium]|nr:sulfite exporter TauE/SafE family protein [Planctomycetota bacterium]
MATLVAVLLLSLFGSLHCAGMCGALVAFAVGITEPRSGVSRALLQLIYHGGRAVSYAVVGGVSGLLGAALDFGGSLVGLQRVACVLAGSMMVLVGVVAVLRYAGVHLPHLPAPRWLQHSLRLGQRVAIEWPPLPRALTIGLLTALLPCGWLYAFAFVAAGAGNAAWGAAIMLAFWLGTVPILISLGTAVQALTGLLGRRLPLATALLIVVVGLGTIAGRWALSGEVWELPRDLTSGADLTQRLQAIHEQDVPPCCRHAK